MKDGSKILILVVTALAGLGGVLLHAKSKPAEASQDAQSIGSSAGQGAPQRIPSTESVSTLAGLNEPDQAVRLRPVDRTTLSKLRNDFRRDGLCAKVNDLKSLMQAQGQDPASFIHNKEPDAGISDADAAQVEKNLKLVRDNQATCTQAGDVYQTAIALALAGDRQAATCYAAGRWNTSRDSEQIIADYKRYAPAFLNEGMKAGDWRALSLMIDLTSGLGTVGLLPMAGRTDPAASFGYMKVMQLGSQGLEAERLKNQVSAAAAQLPRNVVAAKTQWASEYYAGHFAHSGPQEVDFSDCQF